MVLVRPMPAGPNVPRHTRRLIRAYCLAAIMLIATVLPPTVHAQEMEVPVSVQVPLFLKVMTFDRQRNQNSETEMVVGVTFQSGYRSSIIARDEVSRTLRALPNLKVRVVLIDLDHAVLKEALEQHGITLLYISPLRAIAVATVAAVAAAARITTVTGVPHYVEQGIVIGARLQGDRPRLMVNLPASKLAGADFNSELLKLAEVIR